MPQTPLFELNPAESIFAPFHDETISSQIPVEAIAVKANGFRLDPGWDNTRVSWVSCPARALAGTMTMPLSGIPTRFDHYVFCLVVPKTVQVQFQALEGKEWKPLGEPVTGNEARMEIVRPILTPASAIRVEFTSLQPGAVLINLQWWAVAEQELWAKIEAAKPMYDSSWSGLILPPEQWGEVKFVRGLLFGEEDIPSLKKRAESPLWKGHFAMLEERARASLSRDPETEIGDYIPWSDYRYLREREHGKEPWTAEPVLCALVGLVRDDPVLIRHALRYLMCFVHTTHWNQSAESNTRGTVWDQRCFLEEMSVTTCALVFDWLDFALTDRARELVRKAIWDKGMSVIQRDMVKWEYVYTINQGPWFCRALILGGLVLETAWPRTKPYVEQAYADMQEGMGNYLLEDGGVDEGVGYFSVTLGAVLPGLMAYARARGKPIREVLPPRLAKSGRFVAVLSAMKPGSVLLDGDNTHERFTGDAIALLASLYPDDVYAKIAKDTLLHARGDTYYRQYMVDGPFAFIAAPDELPEPSCIVPEFGHLPQTGHLTSRRSLRPGREVRLHLAGSKARASHTHFDKGAFTMELDDLPVLIDRGMVRYDDIRSYALKRSELHNVITPVAEDGSFVNQCSPQSSVIPEGYGDARVFNAKVNLATVWEGVMAHCSREIISPKPEQFTIMDQGELHVAHVLAFHLQTRERWTIFAVEKRAELTVGRWKVTVEATWADEIFQAKNLIDHRMEPVWHLQFRRGRGPREFALETRFACEWVG